MKHLIHHGEHGDLVYGLCAAKAIADEHGPVTLYLRNAPPTLTRERMTPERAEKIAPLIRLQPYIHEVRTDEPPPEARRLDAMRGEANEKFSLTRNIADQHLEALGLPLSWRNDPWVEVDRAERVADVVIQRSPRSQNPRFPWRAVVEKYAGRCVFVGLPEEYEAFRAAFGELPYHPTADFLELARVIAGCRLFCGNSSSPYALAEAMKKRVVQEVASFTPTSVFIRPEATLGVDATVAGRLPEPEPRVLYELTHTACDREILRWSRLPADVFHGGGKGWNSGERPRPVNASMVDGPRGPCDVACVSSETALDRVPPGTPVVWKCLSDWGRWPKPEKILPRVAAWVAPCAETVERWGMAGDRKAMVIEHGIDSDVFRGWKGSAGGVMTVGSNLPARPEKGPEVLAALSDLVPVEVFGSGNDAMASKSLHPAGPLGLPALAAVYRRYGAYFNPSTVVVCAVLEAMATGMPVVTMAPGNFRDLMRDGENCLIASDPAQAAELLQRVLADRPLAERLGAGARRSVVDRLHPRVCGEKWRALLCRVAGG